jgi:pilus assembly protein CpaF
MTVMPAPTRYGYLADLLEDPLIEEIIVIGGERTFIVRNGVKELVNVVVDASTVRRIADQLLAGTGRRVDIANPIVSAQLPDGSRVHITGPPVTHPDRMNIQIRKFVVTAADLADMVERGTLTRQSGALLRDAMTADATILVAGAPGAGKTTLVNCLLKEVPPAKRVVTCEEVFEIDVDLPDLTQMQTRESGLDGGAEITLRDLVREALRQRPDRIVVGEVRGPEALDMLLALNAGCSGLATIHANSASDALEKLVSYGVLAGDNIGVTFLRRTIASVLDVVVYLKRTSEGRRVHEILAVPDQLDVNVFTVSPLYAMRNGALTWVGQGSEAPSSWRV